MYGMVDIGLASCLNLNKQFFLLPTLYFSIALFPSPLSLDFLTYSIALVHSHFCRYQKSKKIILQNTIIVA